MSEQPHDGVPAKPPGTTASPCITADEPVRFSDFDTRGYPTVDVRAGYAAWVTSYERSVEDEMDIALLEELSAVPWSSAHRAADLGCGTGRTGAWLRGRGVESIDGVDLTPEMIAMARSKEVYGALTVGDVTATGLTSETYDLVTTCLVDEHLRELSPLYREARRIARPGGHFVLVGYHPHFIMLSGMPTHYHGESDEPVAIETYVHLVSEHIAAGLQSGWVLDEMRERVIDDAWIALKPQWARFRHHPISMALAWHGPRE